MREKQRERVTETMTGVLEDGEVVEQACQAIVGTVPIEQGVVGRAAREVAKRVNGRAAVRNEGFVVLTSRRLLFLGKTAAGRPTSEVRMTVEREDIDSVDYKRGIMSTLTVVPATGDVAVTFTCGLVLRAASDAMADALGAR